MKCNHCLFCCSVAGTKYRCLIYTTNSRAICVSSSEQRHCKTLLSFRWTHRTTPQGWTPLSWISPTNAQSRSAYINNSFWCCNKRSRIWTACWSAVLPVGGLQRPCSICWFSSLWELAGSGRSSLCRDQRKHVFHNMGPLTLLTDWLRKDSLLLSNYDTLCEPVGIKHTGSIMYWKFNEQLPILWLWRRNVNSHRGNTCWGQSKSCLSSNVPSRTIDQRRQIRADDTGHIWQNSNKDLLLDPIKSWFKLNSVAPKL